ncbi:hypothetical protein CALVIDRAFT_537453 [Calocera viscosa TUFC12733]|uniref:GST N-terminal domain-containing protein n=1 Tax=Calocera viscosa (strain TUFC12733) TaxID=1330018 RepID=A0A167M2Q9_CALVF|nr:hypothetical protein CALVIDRAFT_537453 [Calocera viscosa TUFC12733]
MRCSLAALRVTANNWEVRYSESIRRLGLSFKFPAFRSLTPASHRNASLPRTSFHTSASASLPSPGPQRTMSSLASSSKAVLYSFPLSVWSRAARFAAYDLEYIPDLIEVQDVNLDIGEQYALSYLRLNPNGTVPTLVAPPGSALNPSSRELVLTDSETIIDLLSLHAHPLGRTAPDAPLAAQILALLRDPNGADPRAIARAPRSEDEFRHIGLKLGVVHIYRQDALESTLRELAGVQAPWAEEMRRWVQKKIVQNQSLIQLWTEPNADATSRVELFKRSRILWGVRLPDTLRRVEELMVGPFCLGEELCAVDYTLGAWLERMVYAAGYRVAAHGLEAVEQKVGGGFKVGPKVRTLWETMRVRPSFELTFGVTTRLPEGVEGGLDAVERQLQQLSDGMISSNM